MRTRTRQQELEALDLDLRRYIYEASGDLSISPEEYVETVNEKFHFIQIIKNQEV